MTNTSQTADSPWPHRLACLVVCATFPLIWVGGLVTTYKAGMAVPDWPSTFGYNLFLYPWQTWLAGPWDLFIEHGHRLFASAVGLLTILLAVVLFRCERRLFVRVMGVVAVLAVVFQGVLGGIRVLENDRAIAMLHGCFGPAFFAFTVALAAVTSRSWNETIDKLASPGDADAVSRLGKLALTTAVLAYLQLVLGAQIRHRDVAAGAALFQVAVYFHLLMAAVLTMHAMALARRSWRLRLAGLRFLGMALGTITLVQVGLGAGTWVLKFGWPGWFAGFAFSQQHLNVNQSFAQATITTAHVATGSLIVALCLLLALRSLRLTGLGRRPMLEPGKWIGVAA